MSNKSSNAIVHSTQDLLLLNHLKNLLEQEEIPCLLEQVHLQGAMGELPCSAWPKLIVVHQESVGKAKSIIKEALKPGVQLKGLWVCRHCNESNEQQFNACWKCGEPDHSTTK